MKNRNLTFCQHHHALLTSPGDTSGVHDGAPRPRVLLAVALLGAVGSGVGPHAATRAPHRRLF